MSKAVLSSQDIVKELAQCLVKVKTDPLLLPFFLFARSLGATTAACQNGLLIKSPVNSGHIFTATDNNNTKKLYRTTESLKSFQKARHAIKENILPSFCFCSCFHNSAKHLGEVRPVGPAPLWLTNPSHDITANLHSCSASEEIQTPLSGRNCIFWSSKQHKQDEMNLKKKKNCREANARNKENIFVASAHANLTQTLVIWWQSARWCV